MDGEVSVASSYRTVGSGDRHVIALHGWFGSARGWGALPDYVDGARFTYVFPDLRGYGGRRGEAGEFTMAEAGADALALADELGWERFSLVGHSMSGKAIQHAMLQAPDRVTRLVALNPVPATGAGFDDDGWALFSGAANARENRTAIINITTGSRLTPAFVDSVVQHSLDHSTVEAFAAYLESWAKEDFSARVQGNPIPVKVIVGEHDPALSAPVMEQTWLVFYPNAELEVLANAGHYPMMETPAALVTTMEEFLGRD
ncbi:MAG TPA: alpha/beta hydrolase [Streptosporangiaceae bacterium]